MYIDKKEYNIYASFEDAKIESPVFEVDELIAPVISILNKKGYHTEYCCSGHMVGIYTNDYGIPNDDCYIKFKNYHDFKVIPDGFDYDVGDIYTIRKYYIGDSLSVYYSILETMKDLLEWAINLDYVK